MPASSYDRGRGPGPRIAALLVLCGLAGAACGPLSVSQERQMGEQIARELPYEMLLLRDRVVMEYVEGIGNDILMAGEPQPFDYRFYVAIDDDINAFATFGGLVVINTSVVLKSRNVSELAGVLAHEIGHVVHRHMAQNYNRRVGANIAHQLGVIVASMFGFGGVASAGGGLAKMAVLNTYTREAEEEADAFAAWVLPRAGYDPEGLVTFFETLSRENQVHVPKLLSSHPATADRIQAARESIAEQPPRPGLRTTDAGRLEIIQRRIELLTGGAHGQGYR